MYDSNNLYPTNVHQAYQNQQLQRQTALSFDFNTGLLNSETDYNGLTRAFIRDSPGAPIGAERERGVGITTGNDHFLRRFEPACSDDDGQCHAR